MSQKSITLDTIQMAIDQAYRERQTPEYKQQTAFLEKYGAMTDEELDALPDGAYNLGGIQTGKGGAKNFVKTYREMLEGHKKIAADAKTRL